jgi:hypothetical protein
MTTARLLALVNRVLPGSEASDTTQRRGRDSEIGVLALVLTVQDELAARTQNQLAIGPIPVAERALGEGLCAGTAPR